MGDLQPQELYENVSIVLRQPRETNTLSFGVTEPLLTFPALGFSSLSSVSSPGHFAHAPQGCLFLSPILTFSFSFLNLFYLLWGELGSTSNVSLLFKILCDFQEERLVRRQMCHLILPQKLGRFNGLTKWPPLFFLANTALESAGSYFIVTNDSKIHYGPVVCRSFWGRPSATPLPFFIPWLQTRALQLQLPVPVHTTTNSQLYLPKQQWQSCILFMDLNEIQVGKLSYSDVLFVTVNVCLCVCLFT